MEILSFKEGCVKREKKTNLHYLYRLKYCSDFVHFLFSALSLNKAADLFVYPCFKITSVSSPQALLLHYHNSMDTQLEQICETLKTENIWYYYVCYPIFQSSSLPRFLKERKGGSLRREDGKNKKIAWFFSYIISLLQIVQVIIRIDGGAVSLVHLKQFGVTVRQ